MSGWLIINRRVLDINFWLNEPFSKGQAWVDLLFLANYEDATMTKRGITFTVPRGCVALGEVKLAERWKWSREKVRRFIFTLKDLGEVTTETRQETIQKNAHKTRQEKKSETRQGCNRVTTLYRLTNYDKQKTGETEEILSNETGFETEEHTQNETRIKEVEEVKELKEKDLKENTRTHEELMKNKNVGTGILQQKEDEYFLQLIPHVYQDNEEFMDIWKDFVQHRKEHKDAKKYPLTALAVKHIMNDIKENAKLDFKHIIKQFRWIIGNGRLCSTFEKKEFHSNRTSTTKAPAYVGADFDKKTKIIYND